MPSVPGVSNRGGQNTSDFVQVTQQYLQLTMPGLNVLPPSVLGYYYVVAKNNTSGTLVIVKEGRVRSPGVYAVFDTRYGLTAWKFAMYVDWNIGGLNYTVSYV